MLRRVCKVLAASTVLFTCPGIAMAASHYVRAGATGTGDGSDWNNAHTALPATLVRGDTYYIADGSYGSYDFDDPVSGTTFVYIKKAIESAHGTDTGWVSTYGDGSATFPDWDIRTSYWEMDGQVGQKADAMHGVPAIPGYVEYGFKVLRNTSSDHAKAIRTPIATTLSHLVIKHVEAGYSNRPGHSSDWGLGQDIIYLRASDVTLSHVWLHDAGRVNILAYGQPDNWLIEYAVIERCGQAKAAGVGSEHTELFSGEGETIMFGVIATSATGKAQAV